MRARFRGPLLACCLAAAALAAVPGCGQPAVLTGDHVNNALGEMSMRKDELQARERAGEKLTPAEKKELRAYRKVNQLTATVFNTDKRPIVRLLAGFRMLDALEKSGSELPGVDLLLVDTLILLQSLAEDLRTESQGAADAATGRVQASIERLIGKGQTAHDAAEGSMLDPERERQLRRAAVWFARAMNLAYGRQR